MNVAFLSFDETNKLIKQEMLNAFEKVFDSKWYILGEEVKKFEQKYAAFNQTKYCVGVSNGLDALILALKALKIGEGDEVIVPSNTYIATVLAVSHAGATPIFIEPKKETFNIDASLIETKITDKTKALIPVHLYGQPCEMSKIMQLAQKYSLYVIEDNAQSHGASCNGKLTGSWGHINATSFYPGKNLGALGDAGAITTDYPEYAEAIATLRNYGSNKKYYNDVMGYNMRLDELQAALLSVKLNYLDNTTALRIKAAKLYDELLMNCENIILPSVAVDCSHVYHLYVIRTNQRNELQSYLKDKGIGTLIHYPVPPHLQQAYQHLGYRKGNFPIAEELADTCLSLPMYVGISEAEVDYVSSCIKKYWS